MKASATLNLPSRTLSRRSSPRPPPPARRGARSDEGRQARPRPPAVPCEIGLERRRVSLRVGKADVPVRADEIGRAAVKARRFRRRGPGEGVEGKAAPVAGADKGGGRLP